MASAAVVAVAACGGSLDAPPSDAGTAADADPDVRATLDASAPVAPEPSGVYFLTIDWKTPFQSQVQLFADLEAAAATGKVRVLWTNADRSRVATRCKTVTCDSAFACATLPTEACVAPSEPAPSPDAFPDFVPNPTPPEGYGFFQTAEAKAGGSTYALTTTPSTLAISTPNVSFIGLTLEFPLSKDTSGVWRGTGKAKASDVSVGSSSLGPGEGAVQIRSLSPDETPAGLPRVPHG